MELHGYMHHIGTKVPLDMYKQVKQLHTAFAATISQEHTLHLMRKLISNQACATIQSMLGIETVAAMLSAAEKTLMEYKGTGKRPIKCTGYGKDHLYFNKKQKKIICPNKVMPGAKEKADTWYESFKYSQEEYNKKCKPSQQDSTRALIFSISLENKKTLFSLLQSSDSSGGNGPQVFIAKLVFSASTTKLVLPIPISNELMHIPTNLGKKGNYFKPIIGCLLDIRAYLSIVWAPFILGICKQHPQLVVCIIKAKDQYTPIQLFWLG
eukprot:9325175-Ditylum_brightwellii.AAC.1